MKRIILSWILTTIMSIVYAVPSHAATFDSYGNATNALTLNPIQAYQNVIDEINQDYGTSFLIVDEIAFLRNYGVLSLDEFKHTLIEDSKQFDKPYDEEYYKESDIVGYEPHFVDKIAKREEIRLITETIEQRRTVPISSLNSDIVLKSQIAGSGTNAIYRYQKALMLSVRTPSGYTGYRLEIATWSCSYNSDRTVATVKVTGSPKNSAGMMLAVQHHFTFVFHINE